ncbi:MAG TPA: TetR family transcriptional regulator, partial [Microthrixaceae bacterium]|nr:TetR family transcriptional regulator [Microthrixaceae bacterium]
MARRTLEERRDEYLAIGSAIISEAWEGAVKDPALALSHVKLADVAKQAGVTKGALYYIWESQEAFWQDLLECLLEVNSTIVSDYLQHVTARRTSDVAGVPTIHDHADSLFESMSTNPRFFTRVGLVSYLSDDEVRSRFDREYQATLATYGTPLALAITSMGRRLREGFDITSVLVAFDAALEGLCLTKRIAPERTPLVQLPDGTKSTLFTVALEAVAIGFSEPVEDGESTELPVGAMADVALRLPPKSLSDSDAPMPDGNQPSRAKVRPTSKDRKEDYLRVAMDILTNFSLGESLAAPVDALAHVSIADVAERAGVTKGAIYHIWPSQEAFRRDLLIRLLDHGRRFGTEQLGKLIEVGLRGEKPLQVLHEASNAT